MITIKDILLPLAFLNGQKGIGCDEEDEIAKSLTNWILLDELFINPHKLSKLKQLDIQSICFSTTALFAEDLLKLIELFNEMKFIPKQVILCLMTENKISYHIKAFHTKHPEVKFYNYWEEGELEEITFND